MSRGSTVGWAWAIVVALTASSASPAHGQTGNVSGAALAEAARRTPVRDLDYGEETCDPRTVEQWLQALARAEALAIRWSGGPCRIVGPGHDAGSRWCAQATLVLRHPEARDDRPMIEVFFEAPAEGRPGAAYAFRAAFRTSDGDDTIRFRRDFERAWVSRFPESAAAILACPAGSP